MKNLPKLFENNRRWVAESERLRPGFLEEISRVHKPEYLWIGCSDSRVHANEIVGLPPGEMFVHRNIANQVIHTDMNCLSVIQFAVEVLKIQHIIVCGHYGCGGVKAALENSYHGLIDNWLRNLQEIIRIKRKILQSSDNLSDQWDRLSEINVIRQALNVGDTTVVQHAWRSKKPLTIHGWIYSIKDGLLKDLGVQVSSMAELLQLEARFFEEA